MPSSSRALNIWLLQIGEELPIDGANTRLMRTANLAAELSSRGHSVTYLNSTFNHQKKTQRSCTTEIIDGATQYRLVLLYGREYSTNVSFKRLLSHIDNARSFRRLASKLDRPDVIVCGYPPVELAREGVKFACRNGIPVAVDCRDMWPEIIFERMLGPVAVMFTPVRRYWERNKQFCMRAASAVTGITEAFVEWGLASAGRARRRLDRSFHLTISPNAVPEEDLRAAEDYWRTHPGLDIADPVIGCFAGALANRLDIRTILDGVDMLDDTDRDRIRIVFCGNGDFAEEIAVRGRSNPAIVAGGWRNAAELSTLMARATFGVLPYPNTPDFLASYPNKVAEYLLAGLPIFTGLEGETGRLLDNHGLKFAYRVGSAESAVAGLRTILSTPANSDIRDVARRVGKLYFDPAAIYPAFADWVEDLARSNSRLHTQWIAA